VSILTGCTATCATASSEQPRARAARLDHARPARDTPEVLRGYANARKLGTQGWSFATGPGGRRRRGSHTPTASARCAQPNGEIEHTVADVPDRPRWPDRAPLPRHQPRTTDAIRADVEALL
jgi:hypothetical protein